jgi:hypothetical protein
MVAAISSPVEKAEISLELESSAMKEAIEMKMVAMVVYFPCESRDLT